MAERRLIYSVDKLSNLRSLVKQDLRELGIKVPKLKKTKKLNQNQSRNSSQDGTLSPNIFGNYLSMVPSKYVSDCGFVPTVLVEAAEIIEKHRDVEGIFRKSGSISRQKELKQQVEEGQPLRSDNVHDVTGVVKQFFRELPDPLFTNIFHDCFVRCYNLDPHKQVETMLLLCLMLPIEHLSTLRFTMKILSDLAARCTHNKMDVGNLAVVLAPNIMHVSSRSQKMNSAEEKLLQVQTAIVGLLIQQAGNIGVVSESLFQRTALMTECFGTEDELDASDDNNLEDTKDSREERKKARKRSNSLQGFVSSLGRGFAKLRRSTEGSKNTSASCGGSSNSSDFQPDRSEAAQVSQSLSVTQPQAELDLPTQEQPMVTPVVMRKRKMSSGETMPFSATKRKAILDQLPQKSALGATPFTPGSSKKHGNFIGTSRSDSPVSSAHCKTVVASCPRKPAKTKHLWRRLSGDKDKNTEEAHEDAPAGVPQSQSAMELTEQERSPLGLIRTVSSPTLQDYSSSPPYYKMNEDNDLNQGFIDLEATMLPSTSQAGAIERGRTLKRADAFKPEQKPFLDQRSASADGSLHRGQPNTVASGLLDGKAENVMKLRRSFDKSDLSSLVPMPAAEKSSSIKETGYNSIPTVFLEKSHSANEKRGCSFERTGVNADTSGSSAGAGSSGGGTSAGSSGDGVNVDSSGGSVGRGMKKPRPSTIDRLKSEQAEHNVDMESSLLHLVLPPPSGFNDQSVMEMSTENMEEASDDESEAGFSTISGGTVIHCPPGQLGRLQEGAVSLSGGIAHYGSSVSVTAPHPPFPLQPSVSMDSLISTESESSEAGVLGTGSSGMNRSASVDSGKGSLLDKAEQRQPMRGIKSSDLETVMVKLEGATSTSLENLATFSTPAAHSMKSMSAEDLKATKNLEKPPTRSHSMHVGGLGKHHHNIIPNLQISANTHSILTRAGFLDCSLPPNVKDVAVPIRSPQRGDSARLSFRRDQQHQCSFRLEKSATFKKDCSSILFPDHATPVKEESNMDLEHTADYPYYRVTDQEHEPMEEEDTRTAAGSSAQNRAKEEVWIMMDNQTAGRQRERIVEEAPRSSIRLKHAEMRMQRHESIAQIQERQMGRVAHSVKQINNSLDQSTSEQANSSLHFHQCTTRNRGVSPIRIPTIFAKHKDDATSTRYLELALKFQGQKREEHLAVRGESANKNSQEQRVTEQKITNHKSQCQREEKSTADKNSSTPKKGKNGSDIRAVLMETIKEVTTPCRQKCSAADQPEDGSCSPLRESTNTKSGSAHDESVQLRAIKGLTSYQMQKYGGKGTNSDRSPGKPVKRLHSPRSPHMHSPQTSKEGEALYLESLRFHEQYLKKK